MSQPTEYTPFHIGTPGKPWEEAERAEWRSTLKQQRDYFTEVVSVLHRLNPTKDGCEVAQYGELNYLKYGSARFPLYCVKSAEWNPELPLAVVTGGCHGYETSGVKGALHFVTKYFAETKGKVNLLVLPCMSPWGYEHIQRWNPEAIDPNRQFDPANPGCEEAAQAMACIFEHAKKSKFILLHCDLHETTDGDNEEFRPARFARDGLKTEEYPKWDPIPDGFFTIGQAKGYPLKKQLAFLTAINAAVEKVTHLAEATGMGTIIREPIVSKGAIVIDFKGTCFSCTGGKFVTTTEVYPDSERTTPNQCNVAQCEVIRTGLAHALAHVEDADE